MTLVSLCITCRNRLAHLRVTLPASLASASAVAQCEIVVVDYGSTTDDVAGWYRRFVRETEHDARRVRYYRVEAVRWNSPHAKNVAHLLAAGSVLVNMDADNFATPELIMKARAVCTHGSFYGTPLHNHDASPGRLAMHREDFVTLGGYAEDMPQESLWLCEDFELKSRAAKYGLYAGSIPGAPYLRHSNVLRVCDDGSVGATTATEEMHRSEMACREYMTTRDIRDEAEDREWTPANRGREWGKATATNANGGIVKVGIKG